jgi:hypothetical protein
MSKTPLLFSVIGHRVNTAQSLVDEDATMTGLFHDYDSLIRFFGPYAERFPFDHQKDIKDRLQKVKHGEDMFGL